MDHKASAKGTHLKLMSEAEGGSLVTGVRLISLDQSAPRAACLQSDSKANTGETGKNSSCKLVLSIDLLPQGVTGAWGTCALP